MLVIVAIAVAVLILLITLIVVCKCVRSGRRKEEPYNVQYHHDSNILTLDGLSESHASDAVQSRQNGKD